MATRPSGAPLVGRVEEQERLVALLGEIDAGQVRVLELFGEPGIGKSRMLAELAADAVGRGMLVLSGRAEEFERDLPHAALIDALDAHLATVDPRRLRALDPDHVRELAAMFPALAALAEPGAALAAERYRAHRAVIELLEWLAVRQPLVLMLDDLHWIDPASTELIAALLRRPPSGRVLLALAHRTMRLDGRIASAIALAEREGLLERMELGPLAPADAAALVGAELAPRTRELLLRDSGGNPFYLLQLLRGTSRPARPGHLDPAGPPIPLAVAAALNGELDALRDAARLLIEGASVVGQKFDPELAALAAELEPGAALAALDELLEAELIRPADAPRRFTFRHPLVGRAVYARTGAGWRLGAHARIAEGLRARGAPASARADHVERSASEGDEPAIAVLIEAGRATASRAPATAARWFAAALRLLPGGDGRRAALQEELAAAHFSAGALGDARTVLEEALDSVRPDDPAARCRLTTERARVEHWLGLPVDARRSLAGELDRIDDLRSPEGLALRLEMAFNALYGLGLEQSRSLAAHVFEDARAVGDDSIAAAAAALAALAAAAAGRPESARDYLTSAVERVDALDRAALAKRLDSLWYLAWAESFLIRYEAALEHAERGLEISRATGREGLVVPLMLATVFPLQMLGRTLEADEASSAALDAARLSGNTSLLLWALWERAGLCARSGDLAAGHVALEESVELARQVAATVLWESQPGREVGRYALLDGDPARATRVLLEACGGPALPRVVPPDRCFVWADLVDAALQLGELERAEEVVARAEEHGRHVDHPVARVLALRSRAELLLARGAAAEAAAAARDAIAQAGSGGLVIEAHRSRATLGRALAAQGDREAAKRELYAAEAGLSTGGAALHRAAAVRALRALGERPVRAARDGATGVDALTAREREVAELVTAGRTNRQIADELFLSVKTVETHLARIFGKLEVSSRSALAAKIARR